MKQTTLNTLSNHALSIITGFLAGMVFIAGMSNISSLEPKDYWQTIGSLSAGFGTLAILIFGWIKADEWKKIEKSKRIYDDFQTLISGVSYIQLDLEKTFSVIADFARSKQYTKDSLTDWSSQFNEDEFEKNLTNAMRQISTCMNKAKQINLTWGTRLKFTDSSYYLIKCIRDAAQKAKNNKYTREDHIQLQQKLEADLKEYVDNWKDIQKNVNSAL